MYDNVRKPESDWYEAGYTAPRTDTAGTGCYDSYWSPFPYQPAGRMPIMEQMK